MKRFLTRKQLIDQSAHFGAAALILTTAWLLGATFSPLSGAAIGFAFGMIREITEPDPVFTPFSLTDVLFWTLGGAVAGAVL